MRTFEYARPANVDEALHMLGRDGEVRPLAGGTDLLTLMKADLAQPRQLVDVKRLDGLTDAIEEVPGGLTLGALATLSRIELHPTVRERYAALAEAAEVAATPQLRNMATIGGNLLQRPRCWYFRNRHVPCWLKGGEDCPAREGENELHALFGGGPCHAVHPSDLAPALLALGAEVRLRGPAGERTLPLAELFALPDEERRTETVVRADELVVEVRAPAPVRGARSGYAKAMDRKVWAFALVGAAATLQVEGGRIAAARLVLGGVAPIPWRAAEGEQLLVGAEPNEVTFARAAEAALADARPLRQNGYKVPLAKALVVRLLRRLAEAS